jgi:hypothetical protein
VTGCLKVGILEPEETDVASYFSLFYSSLSILSFVVLLFLFLFYYTTLYLFCFILYIISVLLSLSLHFARTPCCPHIWHFSGPQVPTHQFTLGPTHSSFLIIDCFLLCFPFYPEGGAVGSSEMLVNNYQTIQSHILKDCHSVQ